MQLRLVTTKSCPDCGCDVVIAEAIEVEYNGNKIRTHCNGGNWETRRFLCGTEMKYVPNFSAEKRTGQCRNTQKYKELKAEKRIIEKQIEDLRTKVAEVNNQLYGY